MSVPVLIKRHQTLSPADSNQSHILPSKWLIRSSQALEMAWEVRQFLNLRSSLFIFHFHHVRRCASSWICAVPSGGGGSHCHNLPRDGSRGCPAALLETATVARGGSAPAASAWEVVRWMMAELEPHEPSDRRERARPTSGAPFELEAVAEASTPETITDVKCASVAQNCNTKLPPVNSEWPDYNVSEFAFRPGDGGECRIVDSDGQVASRNF
jgi:hypothetical protein